MKSVWGWVWELLSQMGRGDWCELCLDVVVVSSSGELGGKCGMGRGGLQRTDSGSGAETTWDVIEIVGGPSVAELGQLSIEHLDVWLWTSSSCVN
jgi:hypothetical protein